MNSSSGPNHDRMVELHTIACIYKRVIQGRKNEGTYVSKSAEKALDAAFLAIDNGLALSEMCSKQIASAKKDLSKVRKLIK